MPAAFGSAIFFAVVALVAAVVFVRLRRPAAVTGARASSARGAVRTVVGWTAAGTAGLALLLVALSCVTQVTTKNVGVVTSFGRPIDALPNGLHLKAPWHKVTEFDAAVQTDSHKGDGDATGWACTNIRIGDQSVACVDNSIRWRIVQDSADELYRDYREFANVRDSLVTRELDAALNEVFAEYDPLASIDQTGETRSEARLETLSEEVTQVLRRKIGDQVEVLNVIIPFVKLDKSTQSKLDAYRAELANTRIARQRQETAAAQADANRRLAGSLSKDPNVLVSKCLDTFADMVEAKQPIPAGFTCWPGDAANLLVQSR